MSIMLHPIVIFVQYNIYASFCCKCGSKEREAPPPRRAASPSPSCSGKRPKVERWRGVNGLANNGLISQKKIHQAMQTIVGRWPPCHVLQPPIYFFIMEDGARRPLSYQKIARNIASKQRQAMQTIVGRWSPCPVLQHPSSSSRNMLSHGGRGAETPVLL